jgi:hypothetical protein
MMFGLPSFFQPEEDGIATNNIGIISDVQLAELARGKLPAPKNAENSRAAQAKSEPTAVAQPKNAKTASASQLASTQVPEPKRAAKPKARSASPKALPRPLPPKRAAPAQDLSTTSLLPQKKPKPKAPTPTPRDVKTQKSRQPSAQAQKAPPPPQRPVQTKPPVKEATASIKTKAPLPPKSQENPNDAFANLIGGAIGSVPEKDGMSAIADALGVGVSTGPLSNTIQQAIASRLGMCWTPLKGAPGAEDLVVEVRIRLLPTSEVDQVEVVKRPPGQFGNVATQRAEQAIRKCDPFNKAGILTLPLDKYRDWREMNITFDPRKYTG